MLTIYYSLKEIIRNNDFVRLNQMLENPDVIRTLHLDNNYVLREVIKKGILSSVKSVLKNNIVWLNFDEDEMLRLSRQYSPHKGIQRLLEKSALDRFEHYLRNAADTDGLADVNQLLDRSAFIKAHAAHGNVADHCGLSELYLALKYSNHPGIVRELLNNKEVSKLVMDEISDIEESLQYPDFSELADELLCLDGFDDELALSKNIADEQLEELEASEEELEDYEEEELEASEEELEDYEEEELEASEEELEDYEEEELEASEEELEVYEEEEQTDAEAFELEAYERDSQGDAVMQDDFQYRRSPSPLATYSLFTPVPSPTNDIDDELANDLRRLYGNV